MGDVATSNYCNDVFINCPFDEQYQPLFQALFFSVVDCGFRVRCALEIEDASEVRFEKTLRIIRESKYGIHDISRTELDGINSLPRFNMPLELGIFLAAKRFGAGNQKTKSCLILDYDKFRYQKFISDIAGQDIQAHNNDPKQLISKVRNWLRGLSQRPSIPGGSAIFSRYLTFVGELPDLCDNLKIHYPSELTYADYARVVSIWLKANN